MVISFTVYESNNSSNISTASKVFAEKAAWDFMDKEKPNFSLSTIEPTLVFGPIVSFLRDYIV